jgi:hypothetical protein
MANEAKITMKLEGMKEFHKVFDEYKTWNKREGADIINAKLYFIALQAMRATKAVDKSDIPKKLGVPSRVNPEIPLVAILVNKQLAAQHKKGLSGNKMKLAIEKYIKRAQTRVGFLRAGWIPCIKKLDYWNKLGDISFIKRYAPKKPTGVKQYGKDKGDVLAAKVTTGTRSFGWIWNMVGMDNKQNSPTVDKILNDGLKEAIQSEISSMNKYIERKYTEQFQKLQKKDTFK